MKSPTTPFLRSPLFIELDEILIREKQNTSESVTFLGRRLEASDLLFQMYQLLFDSLDSSTLQHFPSNTLNFLIALIGGCQRGFVVGMDRLLKGYYTDSYQSVRLSVEAGCFVYKGCCHPHLIPVWLEAFEGDEQYREFQDKFQKKFVGNEAALSVLKDIYDECSKNSHANPWGVSFSQDNADGTEVGYFDKRDNQFLELAYWTAVDAHWYIFALMQPIFIEFLTEDEGTTFMRNLMAVGEISTKGQKRDGDNFHESVVHALVN